jgi:hypothetical protein
MLWLLNTFPVWVFHSILIGGFALLIVAYIFRMIPFVSAYALQIKVVSLVLIVAGLMFQGAISLKKDYDVREAKLQQEIDKANTRAAKIVTEVIEQVVYRDKIITKQGQDVIIYIDREAEKIDQACTLAIEAVNAHNAAATNPLSVDNDISKYLKTITPVTGASK